MVYAILVPQVFIFYFSKMYNFMGAAISDMFVK